MILPYIIKVALVLGACLAFYKILLRRETFYVANRYILVACLAFAFALPLVPVPQQLSLQKIEKAPSSTVEKAGTSAVHKPKDDSVVSQTGQRTPSVQQPAGQTGTSSISTGDLMNWLFWMYWFGVAVFAASFIFQLVVLWWRARRNPVIIDGRYRIVEMSGDKAPCSFGNTIYINPAKYDWDTYNQILLHEKIHIRQGHTMDIILAELVLMFQWFNPFAWLYRKEMESNLEYLTDDQLMQHKTVDKETYQLSLVKVSAPHFPLSLTTNYNQSILKKRIAMMNAKRSNLHTAWKYFFLLPLLAFLACLLNEPVLNAQKNDSTVKEKKTGGMETEGYWFAVIKDDRVNIRFSEDKLEDIDDDFSSGRSFNSNTFRLSDLGNIPRGTSGSFSISREAGKMEMTGKFDGNTGMGTYKFVADKAYVDYMNTELKEKLDDNDQMAFFFINIRRDYLEMLKKEGFTNVEKDELIPMAAMKIDNAYIKSIRDAGFKDITLENLVPLKALKVDGNYIKEIREAGYKDVTADQLVSLKAQGVDKEYIKKMQQLDADGKNANADDLVALKALNIDDAFINSFKAAGINNIPRDELVSFKAVGVTPEYIRGWYDLGYKDIKPEDFVGMKSQGVTPEFMKTFTDMGYKNIKPEELVAIKALSITPEFIRSFQAAGYANVDFDQLPALKSLGITPEYIKSFEAIGYKNIDLDDLPGLKAQNVTPQLIKSFEDLGFKNIDLDDMIAVKAVGVTPEYIKDMKAKGFNYDKLQKYVTLKTIQ